jgi:hypothetical protein
MPGTALLDRTTRLFPVEFRLKDLQELPVVVGIDLSSGRSRYHQFGTACSSDFNVRFRAFNSGANALSAGELQLLLSLSN